MPITVPLADPKLLDRNIKDLARTAMHNKGNVCNRFLKLIHKWRQNLITEKYSLLERQI